MRRHIELRQIGKDICDRLNAACPVRAGRPRVGRAYPAADVQAGQCSADRGTRREIGLGAAQRPLDRIDRWAPA